MPSDSHKVAKYISKRLRSAESTGVFFGDVVYEAGGHFGPRLQQDYQLVALVEGGVAVEVDGRRRDLKAGQVGLFLPGGRETFTFDVNRKSHHTWCAVRPELVSPDLAAACQRATERLSMTRRLEQIMEVGLSLPLTTGAQAHGLIDALGMAALQAYLFTDTRQERRTTDEPDALRRALAWLGQEGSETVDLATLAKAAGVSSAQLVKLFKRHLGTTPLRYVWETRTRRGAQLLRETGLTVGEVAFRCGFQTPFHFSRWVKQLYGVSPKEFRSREWGRE
jgi:AraC-like DNA-binding protein